MTECRPKLKIFPEEAIQMANLLYACRINLDSITGLESVCTAYRDWMSSHYYNNFQISDLRFEPSTEGLSDQLPPGHSLSSSVYEHDSDKVVQVSWSYPDNRNPGLLWINNIRVGRFGNSCSVDHRILIESIKYSIRPAQKLRLGSPRVVRDICVNMPTFIGTRRIHAAPYDVVREDIEDLLGVLFTDNRKFPVVLLSPYSDGDPNLIDADQLARNLPVSRSSHV